MSNIADNTICTVYVFTVGVCVLCVCMCIYVSVCVLGGGSGRHLKVFFITENVTGF